MSKEEKFLNRLEELETYYYEETNTYPSMDSKNILIGFYFKYLFKYNPSVVLSPEGFYALILEKKTNKVTMTFDDKKYVEFLFMIKKSNEENHGYFEGKFVISDFIDLHLKNISIILKEKKMTLKEIKEMRVDNVVKVVLAQGKKAKKKKVVVEDIPYSEQLEDFKNFETSEESIKAMIKDVEKYL